jgi:hypothetical protein
LVIAKEEVVEATSAKVKEGFRVFCSMEDPALEFACLMAAMGTFFKRGACADETVCPVCIVVELRRFFARSAVKEHLQTNFRKTAVSRVKKFGTMEGQGK